MCHRVISARCWSRPQGHQLDPIVRSLISRSVSSTPNTLLGVGYYYYETSVCVLPHASCLHLIIGYTYRRRPLISDRTQQGQQTADSSTQGQRPLPHRWYVVCRQTPSRVLTIYGWLIDIGRVWIGRLDGDDRLSEIRRNPSNRSQAPVDRLIGQPAQPLINNRGITIWYLSSTDRSTNE